MNMASDPTKPLNTKESMALPESQSECRFSSRPAGKNFSYFYCRETNGGVTARHVHASGAAYAKVFPRSKPCNTHDVFPWPSLTRMARSKMPRMGCSGEHWAGAPLFFGLIVLRSACSRSHALAWHHMMSEASLGMLTHIPGPYLCPTHPRDACTLEILVRTCRFQR